MALVMTLLIISFLVALTMQLMISADQMLASSAQQREQVRLDAMVLGATSPTFTPPAVTMASLIGRGAVISSVKCFSVCTSACRCSFVRLFAFSPPESPARHSSTGKILRPPAA